MTSGRQTPRLLRVGALDSLAALLTGLVFGLEGAVKQRVAAVQPSVNAIFFLNRKFYVVVRRVEKGRDGTAECTVNAL